MSEARAAAVRPDTTVNCCNGRVGRRIAELAAQNEQIQRLAMPTGVAIIREAAAAGVAADTTVNCCNGRVGRRFDVAGLVAQLTASAEQE
jgi:hypothetical protein